MLCCCLRTMGYIVTQIVLLFCEVKLLIYTASQYGIKIYH